MLTIASLAGGRSLLTHAVPARTGLRYDWSLRLAIAWVDEWTVVAGRPGMAGSVLSYPRPEEA